MRWKGRQGSNNVEDRRGGGGGGGRRMGGRTGKLGLAGIVIAIIITLITGKFPTQFFASQQGGSNYEQRYEETTVQPNDELGQFVSVVLKDTEDVWNKIFREEFGKDYREPTLVLFSGQVTSACGHASATTGPFYCPADQKLYIDLSFYRDLKERFKAPGDFAMAYVVAHEVAHHVQFLMGVTHKVQSQRGRISKAEYNDLSVRTELQADFLAGVWAHHAQKMKDILEQGDVQEALNAAQAIGDDRLQMEARGYLVPESFTHGTSAQRMEWFSKGLKTGDIRQSDTFNTNL